MRAANNKGRTISQTDMANTIMLIVWRSWRSYFKWEILQFWNDELQMEHVLFIVWRGERFCVSRWSIYRSSQNDFARAMASDLNGKHW